MGQNNSSDQFHWELPESPYTPIDCNFHDRLLSWATLRTLCEFELRPSGDAGVNFKVQGVITDVFTKDQQEFAVLKSGFTFRLDQIISINGILRPSEGACDIKE